MKDIASDIYTLDDVFRDGFGVFLDIFRKCAPIFFACAFVSTLLAELVVARIPFEELLAPLNKGENGEAMFLKAQAQLTTYIQMLFNFFILSIAHIATIKLAEASVTKRPIATADAMHETFRRYPRVLATVALGGLIIFGMTLLLIVPGIIWNVYYLFAMYVVAITSLSGKKALDYSKSLVKGSFWRTLGFFCCINIAAGLVAVLISLALASLVNLVPEKGRLVAEAVSGGLSSLVGIFTFSLGTVFFLNTAYVKRNASANPLT